MAVTSAAKHSAAADTSDRPSSVSLTSTARLSAVEPEAYVAELPALIEEISAGMIAVQVNVVPLAGVERAWTGEETPG